MTVDCEIPEFLRPCRFLLLGAKSKKPVAGQRDHFESDACNYAIDDPDLLAHIAAGGNYGVIPRNGVCIIDCDAPALWETIPGRWKLSYAVKTGRDGGGGKHIYLLCTDAPAAQKYLFGERGDIRLSGHHSYVLGPGSVHDKTHRRYVLADGGQRLITVKWANVLAWIEENGGRLAGEEKTPESSDMEAPQWANIHTGGQSIADKLGLDVSTFLMPENTHRRSTGEIEGAHPVHGSTTGSNLVISTDDQKWWCRRHGTGGGPLEALAVAEGIVDCDDVRAGCLEGHWAEVFAALRQRGFNTDALDADTVALGLTAATAISEAADTPTPPVSVSDECAVSDERSASDFKRKLTKPAHINSVSLTPENISPENLVRLYYDAVKPTTDAYPDFITAAGIWAVSAVVARRAVVEANGQEFQLNTWFMLLGQSTTSRKSTVINAVDKFVVDLFPQGTGKGEYLMNPCPRLDDDWSPQSLVEMLDYESGSQKWLCIDEAARLLADFERTYMSGAKDFLCKIYDGTDHKRQLRTGKRKDAKTEFHVKKPYLPLLAATTPDAFSAHVSPLDLKSGWMVRFLFVHPRGGKTFMPIGEYIPPSDETAVLIERFRELNGVLSGFSVDSPLKLRLSPDAITAFAEWQRDVEKLLVRLNDETVASAYGRLIVYAMKLAGLYTLADADLKGRSDTGVVEIPARHIQTAIEQIDGYFLPMFVDTAELVERNHTQNLQTVILGHLRAAGGALTQRDLMRKTRVKIRDLSDAISALVVSGDVETSKPDAKGMVEVRLV